MELIDTICELYEDDDIRKIINDLLLISTKIDDIDNLFSSEFNTRLTEINKQSITGMISYFLCNLLRNNNYDEIEISEKLRNNISMVNNTLHNLLMKYNVNVMELKKMSENINIIIKVFAGLFSTKYDVFECVNDNGYLVENDINMLNTISRFIEETLLPLAYSIYDCNFSKSNDFIDKLMVRDNSKNENHFTQEMINRLSKSVEIFSLDFFKHFDIKTIPLNKFLNYSFEKKIRYFIDTSVSVKNIFYSTSKYIDIYINIILGLIIYLTSKDECISIYPELSKNIEIINNKIEKDKNNYITQPKYENETNTNKKIELVDIESDEIFNDDILPDFTTMAICLTETQDMYMDDNMDDNNFNNSDTFID
jgi:hypothetical protein